jgi:hypothetical protein
VAGEMRAKQSYHGNAELFLLDILRLTTHHNRRCPFCHGTVYRERPSGLRKFTILFGLRPYRCEACDKVHYGFRF